MPRGELLSVIQPYELAQQESILVNEVGNQLEHKCGLGGVMLLSSPDTSDLMALITVRQQISDTLEAVKNRGHDSTGIAYFGQDRKIMYAGGNGTVTEAFSADHQMPVADTYIGHVRYGTVTLKETERVKSLTQPVLVSYNGWKMALGHNGNVPEKYRTLVRDKIPQEILERENLDLDSAELAWAIVTAPGDTWEEKMHVLDDIPCAFQLIMLTQDEQDQETMYALADRTGMWPLVVGRNENMIVMSSEDTGLPEGMEQSTVQPGQLVKANRNGIEIKQFFDNPHVVRCILQDAYGINREAHLRPGLTGEDFSIALGWQIAEELSSIEGNVLVAGVPQTGLPIAEGLAKARGTSSVVLVEKNPEYTGKRTFIAKDAATRRRMALEKYNITNSELLEGAKLILVDDSAVRGNTFKVLFQLLKNTGVSELHFVSGLPAIVDDCDFGYFIKKDQSLLALQHLEGDLQEGAEQYILRTEEEIVQEITEGEETNIHIFMHFLSKEGLEKVYRKTMHLEPNNICSACTGGGSGPDQLALAAKGNSVVYSGD